MCTITTPAASSASSRDPEALSPSAAYQLSAYGGDEQRRFDSREQLLRLQLPHCSPGEAALPVPA